jgi:hypothetical protein
VSKRLALLVSILVVASAVLAQAATPSRYLLKGVYDDANLLYGDPDVSYKTLGQLKTKVVRLNMWWGGKYGVAGSDPTVRPADPNDGQYDWSLYDRAVFYATQYNIKVVFSIVGTPNWANGNKGVRVAPTAKYMSQLRDFAYAAATRYSGTFQRPSDGAILPSVKYWIAWNEPNNPIWLTPQFRGRTIVSGATYAKLCNAVVQGVKATLLKGEKTGCGVTAPRGNNAPRSARPSVSPLAFARAMKRGGAKGFTAYAHHPYYGLKTETPMTKPKSPTAITLGNIGLLQKEVRRLFGPKRFWITEYGYQTMPPRDAFGVTYAQQAKYLKQAWKKAKANRTIDMFIWFLYKDDSKPGGWQSGFVTQRNTKKPSFNAFRNLR